MLRNVTVSEDTPGGRKALPYKGGAELTASLRAGGRQALPYYIASLRPGARKGLPYDPIRKGLPYNGAAVPTALNSPLQLPSC